MRANGTCGLTNALLAMLADAGPTLISRKQQTWHSATFSGERVTIVVQLEGSDCFKRAETFANALPDAEFQLRRQCVADILVSERTELEDRVVLTVEALLLDE